MSTQGTATIDFGAKETTASVAVSSAAITGTNLVEAWVLPATTADNTVDNHLVEPLRVIAGNIQAGVGFTIYAMVDEGLAHGKYNIGWVWN